MKYIYSRQTAFISTIAAAILTITFHSVPAQTLPQVCKVRGQIGTAPPAGGTGVLPNRITRPGSPTATCSGVSQPNPFNAGAGSYLYNVHYIKNPTIFPICIPVRLEKTNPSVSGADLQVSAFLAPFDANDITNSARFRGDAGNGTGAFSLIKPTTFSIAVPGNSTVALVVYNTVNGSTAAEDYQLDFCTSTVSYTGAAVSIPDNSPTGVNINLPVPASGRVTDLNFRFDTGAGTCDATPGNTNAGVSHTFVGDLNFRLIAPGGFPSSNFMSRRGGTRENICSMLIDDEGGFASLSSITNQTGFFVSGNYAPEPTGLLSRFDGEGAQGTWVLNVSDNASNDNGFLRRFTLEITTGAMRRPVDFDGDLRSDVSIYRPNAGEWWIRRSRTGDTVAVQFGLSTDRITPGDYTGDGISDVSFFRPSTGEWFILRSDDGTFYSLPFGALNDIPVPGDFDGDTFMDPAVFRPSTNTWFISRSTGGVDILPFGSAGDKPVAADYDGDGKSDVAIYRPSGPQGSQWWIRSSKLGNTSVLNFGISTDRPVPGDYTGDGKADIAVFRPATGFWYILRSQDFSFYSFPFGANGDVPVPADYDGDGTWDAAVFRPSTTNWFVQGSQSGVQIQQFGSVGDFPTPTAYIP